MRLLVALLVFPSLFIRFCQIADLIVKYFFLITLFIYLLFYILYIGVLRKNNIQIVCVYKMDFEEKKYSINTKSVAIF